jgi:hypothetical protein
MLPATPSVLPKALRGAGAMIAVIVCVVDTDPKARG